MSNLSESICIIPGGDNHNNDSHNSNNDNNDNNNLSNNIELNIKYKDYNIICLYSSKFLDDINLGFLVKIENNFDIYNTYISHETISKSNSNTKFIKTIEINPNMIIENINNKNIIINKKYNSLEFIINITELKNSINLIINKDNNINETDIKIKKLEAVYFKLNNKINSNSYIIISNIEYLIKYCFNDDLFADKYYLNIHDNMKDNININDYIKELGVDNKFKFNYNKKYQLLVNDRHFELNMLRLNDKLWNFKQIFVNNICFYNNQYNSNSDYLYGNFINSNYLFKNIFVFNLVINYLLTEKKLLLTKIIFFNTLKKKDIDSFTNILNNFISNNSETFFSTISNFESFKNLELELLPDNHNIKSVFFEIIDNNTNINMESRNYIFKTEFNNNLAYGIYTIEK